MSGLTDRSSCLLRSLGEHHLDKVAQESSILSAGTMENDKAQTYDIPKSTCPTCGYSADRATTMEGACCGPKEGDASICFRCASVLRMDKDLKLELATDEYMKSLPQELQDEIQSLRSRLLNRRIRHSSG